MNPIEQAKEALRVLYSHGTSHITNARERMLIQDSVEAALAALEAEQSGPQARVDPLAAAWERHKAALTDLESLILQRIEKGKVMTLTQTAVKLLQLVAQTHTEANRAGAYSTLPCDPQVIEALCADWLKRAAEAGQ